MRDKAQFFQVVRQSIPDMGRYVNAVGDDDSDEEELEEGGEDDGSEEKEEDCQ